MVPTPRFSMGIEPKRIRKIDEEVEHEYKTQVGFIKKRAKKMLKEKEEKEYLKKLAAELWLKCELSELNLRKALSEEEIKDLKFGKQWVDGVIREIIV